MFEDITEHKRRLEAAMRLNIADSALLAELMFRPSFRSQGRDAYVQIRQYPNRSISLFCQTYEYSNGELHSTILPYSSLFDSPFIDTYCGMYPVPNDAIDSLLNDIDRVNELSGGNFSVGVWLDGYFTCVRVSDRLISWRCDELPDTHAAAASLVGKVFSILPHEYRMV